MKRALIFGVGGQDGSYLAELLVEKGYEVHGSVRRSSVDNLSRVRGCLDRITIHRADLCDPGSVDRVLRARDWDEVYNMADQDEVGWSKDSPGYSVQVTYGGVATILECLRYTWDTDRPRFFQPVSSTMFGPTAAPQDEGTPLNPGSPYAVAKAAAFLLCRHYRREHGLYVSCGIMFNHDSPRRGPNYLLQQIARQAIAVSRGERERIELTGPDAYVDVGWAPDYVDAAWRTLQQDAPDDYVVGTGEGFSVSDLCVAALERATGREDDTRFFLRDSITPVPWNQAEPGKIIRLGWGETIQKTAYWVVQELVNHFKEVR